MKHTVLAILVVLLTFLSQAVSAQDGRYPNELKGYDFFASGRLKDLELLVSTKVDVTRVMGEKCENGCDYDRDWTISFAYVNSGWSKQDRDLKYRPKDELVGKLASITFRPRRTIVLSAAVVFPKELKCDPAITTSSAFPGEYPTQVCMDEKRVVYVIARETVSDGSKVILKRQLMHIDYTTSEKDFNEIFVLADR
jgi:hypothetical protein